MPGPTLSRFLGLFRLRDATDAARVAAVGINGEVSVKPQMSGGGNGTKATNATGTTYNALDAQACKQVTIVNNTGTAIGVRQGGAGAELPVIDQSFYTFYGMADASDLAVRRVDTSNTPVTVAYRWEA